MIHPSAPDMSVKGRRSPRGPQCDEATSIHPWRSAKQFRLFLYASVLGLVMFAILHNVFEAVASKAESAGTLQILLQGLGVAAFLLAVLICPPAILVGAVGSVVMFIRNRRRPTQGRDTAA